MSAVKRRKRVQVGWYCNHVDEAYGERTHLASHGKYKRGKWVETWPEPNTVSAMSMLDHRDSKKRPPCARATPMYVMEDGSDQ